MLSIFIVVGGSTLSAALFINGHPLLAAPGASMVLLSLIDYAKGRG